MRSGMSSINPGAVDEHNQRGKKGLGAQVLKSVLPFQQVDGVPLWALVSQQL